MIIMMINYAFVFFYVLASHTQAVWPEASPRVMTVEDLVNAFRAGLAIGSARASEDRDLEKDTPAPLKPKVKAAPRRKGAASKPFYVIFGTPERFGGLLGVHHCSWRTLEAKLPGQRLIGSGVQDCKRFEEVGPAIEYWQRRSDSDSLPALHIGA